MCSYLSTFLFDFSSTYFPKEKLFYDVIMLDSTRHHIVCIWCELTNHLRGGGVELKLVREIRVREMFVSHTAVHTYEPQPAARHSIPATQAITHAEDQFCSRELSVFRFLRDMPAA